MKHIKKENHESILPVDEDGQFHGYCIYYWYIINKLMSHGNCIHNKDVGYWCDYNTNGVLKIKTFYII